MAVKGVDPREAFLQERSPGGSKFLTPQQIEDAKFFRQRVDEGRRVPRPVVIAWFKTTYPGFSLNRAALHEAFKAAGVEPWWSKGS